MAQADDLTARLMTVTGQIVYEQRIKVVSGNTTWVATPQTELSSGVYFVQLETSRGIMIRKVVKR